MSLRLNFKRTSIGLLGAAIAVLEFIHPSPGRANVIGTDAQNFNTTTSGLDFVTVQSSETLKPGIVNLGVFLNYAVNSLPYFDESPQGRLRFNDTLLGLDMNAGIGLTENWDFGVSFPQVLSQTVEDQTGSRGEFAQNGATEIRVNTKYRFFGDAQGGLAAVASVNFNQIQDNPYLGEGAGPTTNLELAADTTINRTALGVNIGYRIRNPGRRITGSLVEPLNNQFIASAAASYHFPGISTKAITELFGSFPAEETTTDGERGLTSLEWIIGAKHDLTTSLSVHAGAGTGLNQGTASPDWRVYTGVNYAFGPIVRSVEAVGVSPALESVKVAGESGAERFRTQSIHFEFDSDKMVGNFDTALRELSSHLKQGYTRLVIEGHTDSVGSQEYNQKLSLRRAEAIRRHLLVLNAADAGRIHAVGFGETRPIADNGNYQGRQLNRRVEFVIRR